MTFVCAQDFSQDENIFQFTKKLCWKFLRCMIIYLHSLFDCFIDFVFGMYYDHKAKRVPPVKNNLLLESAVSLAEKIRFKLLSIINKYYLLFICHEIYIILYIYTSKTEFKYSII